MILPPVLSSVRAEIRHLSGGFEKTPSEYDCNRARLAGAARLESVAEYRTVRDQSVAMPDILQPVWATTVAPCSSQNNIVSTAATHTPLPQRVISNGRGRSRAQAYVCTTPESCRKFSGLGIAAHHVVLP